MTLDETKNQKDSSQAEDASKGKGGTSGNKEPETFTTEQMAESNQKAVSDALAKAGRTAQAFERREQATKAAEDRATEARVERRRVELEANRDNVEALTDAKARHKLEDATAELARVKLELEAEKEKGTQTEKDTAETNLETTVWGLAQKHNVDAEKLKSLSKFTDGSAKAIEALAKELPKTGDTKKMLVDSGKIIGSGEITEQAKLDKLYPSMAKK